MARIGGVNLPPNKRIEAALTYIYGVGFVSARKALTATGVDPNKRSKDLSEAEENKLRTFIEKNFKLEGELRQQVSLNIKLLKEIGSHRGMRHSKGLPVRGQRTKTNSRTRRGNVRRTVSSGRKQSDQKT
ncbi:MAG: 30S ribosomal protein S13 [Candidatus Doudnabacteria bacterium CG10_big_fil_rev_8_21_14_0_10_41_10]|uniref:Small ribosomal subunit protein uS13 n=1 Tax=Candidatus Doudnabacteria bacterium CG10_big_fil_rev_8_21_14_0_10_41_10 TaxID=1974551 RepID=A0A2H0VD66_9BACT|nr:MAG: 30S ribosomal protein S13 [Candidatus Doudnabacteria bacterium CG10_big_fil_rev_8_21_14_0_10_41_10]